MKRTSSPTSPSAIYAPSITEDYARIGIGRGLKRSFAFSEGDLDFLDPGSGLFHYPFALYSAGQAAKSDVAALEESTVSRRNRSHTIVIGDSGGFQIQQGTIQFDGEATLERMLRWLERTSDYSMVLDFPTGGISSGEMERHEARLFDEGRDIDAESRRNGQSRGFNACLVQTRINNDYFAAHRTPGATRFLNVIQGRNNQESQIWYDAVKDYPFEGYALAGGHRKCLSMALHRLIDMWDEGRLEACQWIHILGASRLAAAYVFTAIRRCLGRINPKIQLSFDTAGPFRSAASFSAVTSFRLDKFAWQFRAHKMPQVGVSSDQRTLNELCRDLTTTKIVQRPYSSIPFEIEPFSARSVIGDRVSVAELCIGSQGSSDLDVDSVNILMNHNVDVYTEAFRHVNAAFDDPHSDLIPPHLRRIRALIEHIFTCQDPRAIIDEHADDLDFLADA